MTKSRGIRPPRQPWTDEQIAILRARYANEKTSVIAKDMGRTVYQIYNRAHKLGLEKSLAFRKSEASGRLQGERGIASRFQKGQPAWNKGVKHPSRGRSSETQFAKGQSPHNTLPIGSYRLDKDGTLQRKINNDKGNAGTRWRGVHELVWVEANGSRPAKHIVVFKPGMRTNVLEEITLDRVECISFAENMKRNTRHNYSPEINELIHMRAVLTRQINKRTKDERTENNQ